MQNEFMAIDIEFHERKDSPQIAIVKVGDRMVAMEIQDWLEFAKGVVERIEAHLTKRAPDALSAPRIPCTCGQDDGLHEWDCAISRARR